MNLSVFQKGLVLVALPLVFQSAFVLAVVKLQHNHAEAGRWAAHTKEVIAQAHEVHTRVNDARAGVQGYVITGEPKFAEPYYRARGDLPGHLDELVAAVGDNSDQAAQAQKVHVAATAMVDWLGEVERLVREGDRESARARVQSGAGYGRMETFRREFAAFLAAEEELDRERQTAVERARQRLNLLFVIGGVVAVCSTVVLAEVFRRSIAHRFAALEDNARVLALGGALPPPLAGSDEIARLDRAFRDMAAALLKASGEARDLYDNAPCGYHSVDQDGVVVAVNRTELRWLGYEDGEVVGRARFLDFVSPASRSAYERGFSQVRERGSVSDVELELVRRDGTTFPVLVSSSSIRGADGRYLRSRTTLTDLTERKRAEAAVRLFADVAQSIPIGLLVYQLGPKGGPVEMHVREGNREAARLLNVSIEGAIGRPVREVFPTIPADQFDRYAAVAATGIGDDLGELRYGDARVSERWWAVRTFPLPDRSVGVAFQDISDRKRIEAEVRRLNAELEDRVRVRTAELEAVNRDLAQKNAENEMFVYSVSHDLRSPLVNLQGFSKELDKGGRALGAILDEEVVPADVRERGRGLLDGKMTKSIGFIQTAVLRLSGIIDAMLRLSRAGRVEYRRDLADVGLIVARVVTAAQGTITERGATVRVGELLPAWGDRTAIEQMFGNLIGNALTYLDPARPGVIEVGCVPPGAESPSGLRTYFVRDNGMGIAEGHRQKIFQAFQRAHPGIGSGEGLGLAIVARVVDRHGGRVWVESRVGEGSTFFVTLPGAAAPGGR